jgi:transposase-like protein
MDKKHPSSKRYPPELKERAVRMVLDLQHQDPDDHGVIGRVARQLGVSALPSAAAASRSRSGSMWL